jgi:tetratricopeptide (TPR) repeat protein
VAERYTYVPYISLAFLLCITGYELLKNKWKDIRTIVLALFIAWILFLSYITFTRIPVWKNSETFWNDVLKHYPESPRAWTNRGLYFYDLKDWPKAINDLTDALKYNSAFPNALEWRAKAYLEVGQGEKAFTDAQAFYNLNPEKTRSDGYTGQIVRCYQQTS